MLDSLLGQWRGGGEGRCGTERNTEGERLMLWGEVDGCKGGGVRQGTGQGEK